MKKEASEIFNSIKKAIEELTASEADETARIEQGGVLKAELTKLGSYLEGEEAKYGELVDKYRDVVIMAGVAKEPESGGVPDRLDLDQLEVEFRSNHPEFKM